MEQKKNDIVEEHKLATMVTGKISDFQLENLKKWPFIVFENLQVVTINYDFTQKGTEDLCAGKVIFDLTFNKDKCNTKEEEKKALSDLSLWTKFLFWKDTVVEFKKDGQKWI